MILAATKSWSQIKPYSPNGTRKSGFPNQRNCYDHTVLVLLRPLDNLLDLDSDTEILLSVVWWQVNARKEDAA